ncbi:MAG: hypothetical protein OD918_05585 [Gammaproteobacteria bacterium]
MHDSLKNSMKWAREQSLLLKRKPSFEILLGVGAGMIILVRLLVDGNMGAVFAVFACIACLCVYYVCQLSDSADPRAPENLYYMGLLFTLVSLIYSLVVLFAFNSGDGDVENRVYNLVGSFGIALFSTFFGILFRILLLQKTLSQDEGELEEQARRNLAETARKLRQELTQTIADMGGFRRAITQATTETVRESEKARATMIQHVEKAAAEQADVLAKMAGKIGDKLGKAGDDAATAAGNVKELLNDLVQQQEKQRQDLIAMGEKSAEQVAGGIREMLGKISGEGENIGTAFNAVLTHLRNVAHDMQETQKSIGELASGYNSLNAEIRQTTTLFSGAASEVEKVAKTISADTKALSESMTKTSEIAPQYTEQFAQQIKVLRQEAEKWQSMTQEVRTTMLQAVKSLTDAIRRK